MTFTTPRWYRCAPLDGNNYTMESGTRLTTSAFTGMSLTSLNDPSLIRLPDGRYRIYVAAMMNGTWVIVSATTSL